MLSQGLKKHVGYVSRGFLLYVKGCLCPQAALSAPPVVTTELPQSSGKGPLQRPSLYRATQQALEGLGDCSS